MAMDGVKDKNVIIRKKILLPIGSSNFDIKILLSARSLAVLLGADIHVLHVSGEALSEKELLEKLKINTEELPTFIIDHRRGDVLSVILKEAEGFDYIILSTDRVGPLTVSIIENSFIPIILLRPDSVLNKDGQIWKPSKILMPLDGTADSAQAVDASLEIIKTTNADIDVLHIFNPCCKKNMEGSMNAPYYEDYPYHGWSEWSREFLKRFFPQLIKPHKIHLHLAKGDPGDSIITFQKDNNNDLIILAWQGILTAPHAGILRKIIHEISCPIFLIRIEKERKTFASYSERY